MPTYDYVCAACGHALEVLQSISERRKRRCPRCGKSRLERQISAGVGFLFKGPGFHITDYRSKSYRSAAKAEKGGDGGAGASKESATPKAEPKAEPKAQPESEPKAQPRCEPKPAAQAAPKQRKREKG